MRSAPKQPESEPSTVRRVRYRERQPLRASDLADEQAYRLAMLRRHLIGGHRWGIVRGLTLDEEAGTLFLEPGVAVDGYGRELVVPERVVVPATVWRDLRREDADAWLLYSRTAQTPPQRGRWDCGPGQHSRWREETRLRLTAVAPVDPRFPWEVSEEDWHFGPSEEPPDDPARPWPVYLGRISRITTDPDRFDIDRSGRPYATLAGERVTAPSSDAVMQLGGEAAGDRQPFVISVRGPDQPDQPAALVERLAIDQDGNTTITGNTTIAGGRNLRIAASTAATAWGAAFHGPIAEPPATATPWRMYRALTKEGADPARAEEVRQLRIEIGNPGDKGDPAAYTVAIGRAESDPQGTVTFVPCLTVGGDCTVTVASDVILEGRLIEGPIRADPNDPRFGTALIDQQVRGAPYSGVLRLMLLTAAVVEPGRRLSYTVHLTNVGRELIRDLRVNELLLLGGGMVRQQQIGPPLTLTPGESRESVLSYDLPDNMALIGRSVTITMAAVGEGAAGEPVWAYAHQAVLIDTGILEVTVTAPETIEAGTRLVWTLSVRNAGRGPLTSVLLHEALSVNGVPVRGEDVFANLTLAPDERRDISRIFDVPGDGEGAVVIEAAARGVRQTGSEAQAADRATVRIVPAP